MDKRLFISELYKNPNFKSTFWHNSEVFNENTPLLKENIEPVLKNYAPYSNCYDTFEEYMKTCTNKNSPQVVGLEGVDHWIAVEFNGRKYKFIDSSGCPIEAYYTSTSGHPGKEHRRIPSLPPEKKVVATQAGHIRQSPLANSCGLYALFICLGESIYHDKYHFWGKFAPLTVQYEPVTIEGWSKALNNPHIDDSLYSNDINMFNFYKTLDGSS